VGGEKCKWGERKERRPVRGYRTGLLHEESAKPDWNTTSPLSDDCRRGIRPRRHRVNCCYHRHHVSYRHRHVSCRPRKNGEQRNYAAPMSRAEARSCAEQRCNEAESSCAEQNCCVAQKSHGCCCKKAAQKSGCHSSSWAHDSWNSATPNWGRRRSQPMADGRCYSCGPPPRNSRAGSSCRNPVGPGQSRWSCPAHSKHARKCLNGPMNSPSRTAWNPAAWQKADDLRRAATGGWRSFLTECLQTAPCWPPRSCRA
jgi:hypothetical protein